MNVNDPTLKALIDDAWEGHDEPLTHEDLSRIIATVRRAERDAWMLDWMRQGTGFPERTEEWFNERIRAQGVETMTGDTT